MTKMTKQYKTVSRSAMARELLATTKLSAPAIAKRTGLSIQTIYTVRWKMANKQGLGAIKPKTSAPKTGIASNIPKEFATTIDRTKPKTKYSEAQRARRARERAERQRQEVINLANKSYGLHASGLRQLRELEDVIVTLEPKHQSIWQRIKGFFVGA